MAKHKVFISYHHKNDHFYKNQLINNYGNDFINHSVDSGDIHDSKTDEQIREIIRDEYIRNASVTIVLIGKETWGRKHVDWEISSSIRHTKYNARNGLIGIVLPSNNNYGTKQLQDSTSIPSRLYKNFKTGFAKIYDWSPNMNLEYMIERAFTDRNLIIPDNSDSLRRRNSN